MAPDDRAELQAPRIQKVPAVLPARRGARHPHLSEWPRQPSGVPSTLTSTTCELLDADSNALDVVERLLRDAQDRSQRRQGLLNDRPYYQRLVLDQGYFPGGLLTALTDEDLRKDIELAKEMGFNGPANTRRSKTPLAVLGRHSGLLVWSEMANAYQYSLNLRPAHHDRVAGSSPPRYIHPCIVAWVPMNESWGVPDLATNPAQIDHLLSLYHSPVPSTIAARRLERRLGTRPHRPLHYPRLRKSRDPLAPLRYARVERRLPTGKQTHLRPRPWLRGRTHNHLRSSAVSLSPVTREDGATVLSPMPKSSSTTTKPS